MLTISNLWYRIGPLEKCVLTNDRTSYIVNPDQEFIAKVECLQVKQ